MNDKKEKTQAVIKKWLFKILMVVLWIGIWESLYWFVDSNLLLPSPQQVLSRLMLLMQEKEFWLHTVYSIGRVLGGFFLAMLVGVVLASISAKFRMVHDFLQPALSIIKSTPVASFIILALVWIKTNHVAMVISFLMVLPVFWTNVEEGIKKTDSKLLEMAKVFRFGKIKTLRAVFIPSVLPFFTAASTTGLGMAWKSGIAAEVLSTPKFSIGSMLYESKLYLETADLFAWTVVVILLSMIIEIVLVRFIRYASEKVKGGGKIRGYY